MVSKNAGEQLFYESLNDAIRSVVQALGGTKKVGAALWPAKPPQQAAQRVTDCLNDARPDKFSPDELLLLAKWGRDEGCHALMAFLCAEAGYAAPVPLNRADRKAALQEKFVEATKLLAALADEIKEIGGDAD